MRLTLRSILIATALLAGGCAARPSQPESTPTRKPMPDGAGASAVGNASASGGESVAAAAPSAGGTPAGGRASADGSGTGVPPARGQTPDERRAALDKRLDDSLGSFDAELRREQQKIAQERDARQVTVATVASDSASGTNPPDGVGSAVTEGSDNAAVTRTSSSSKRGEMRGERAGDLKSEKSAPGAADGNGTVASEIPDGNDDDIVARRLRKAAEQETDPELKDRLWKEYVEYKKNAQGK